MRRALLAAAALTVVAVWPHMAAAAGAEATGSGSVARAMDGDDVTRLKVFGLTDNQRLVTFSSTTPTNVHTVGAITGLVAGTALVGIDFRVQNGLLYGVGDDGSIYTLNTTTAVATKVDELTVALSGTQFGVDFNPAVNRLRIVSDDGQNLRHNIDDATAPLGTIVDSPLTLPNAEVALGVTGAAYTHNDLDPLTGTTLFDVDTANDTLAVQSPANAGILSPTGSLGVNAGPSAGFDIYFSSEHDTNLGFATLQTNGFYRFYHVSLVTGSAQLIRSFPVTHQVTDIALPLDQKPTLF